MKQILIKAALIAVVPLVIALFPWWAVAYYRNAIN